MRPITLRTLVSKMKEIDDNKLDLLTIRSREIINFLKKLGLVEEKNGSYLLSVRGKMFLNAYKNKKPNILHNIFMDIDEYKKVYEEYIHGFSSPSEIANKTGLNNVVVDVTLRLINELESLSNSHTLINKRMYKQFANILLNKYILLRRQTGNRYVELTKLRSEVQKEIFLTSKLFKKLLETFIRNNKNKVILAGAPLLKTSNSNSVTLFGKSYVYIMIDVHK